MSLPITKQILFRTSAATSVISQGGVIKVEGLFDVNKKNLTSITQVKYRAEVAQVVTVGSNSYTPVGATLYRISLFDPNRRVSGAQEAIKFYSYTTPDDVTTLGNAAAQREAIHVAIIAAVNADPSNHAVAATLAGGTGFTITDDGSYYPAHSQSMSNVQFVNQVLTISGFTADPTITTAGVTSSGVGASLAADAPVANWMNGGNLTSGNFNAPLTIAGLPAVSGQKYDAFVIQSLALASNETASGQQLALVNEIQTIWLDNGTGSDVTNLAGFKATERVLHKLMVQVYATDQKTVQEFFDKPIVFQGPLGAAPAGTADVLGWQLSPYGSLNITNIGTQTIVAPVLAAAGLLLDQDDNAGDGSHVSANQQTLGDQSFIVGQTAYTMVARVVAGDWTDTQFMAGIRIKAAYAADYNNYTDLAAIGGAAADGDSITTTGILNNAATVSTDSTVNFADGVSILLKINVAINGTVTAYYAGSTGAWVSVPIYSVGTTTLVLDAGDEFIPFYQTVNIGSGDPAVTISEFVGVADDQLFI